MLKKRLDEATRKRVHAGRLFKKGKKPAEVALKVGVARQTKVDPIVKTNLSSV